MGKMTAQNTNGFSRSMSDTLNSRSAPRMQQVLASHAFRTPCDELLTWHRAFGELLTSHSRRRCSRSLRRPMRSKALQHGKGRGKQRLVTAMQLCTLGTNVGEPLQGGHVPASGCLRSFSLKLRTSAGKPCSDSPWRVSQEVT